MSRPAAQQLAKRLVARKAPSNIIIPKQTRPFSVSTSRSAPKAPSIAQIDGYSDNVSQFKSKQKEYRAQLTEAKEKAESQSNAASAAPATSAPASVSSASVTSTASSSANIASDSGVAKARTSSQSPPIEEGGVKGALNNLLYGTKEGREMEKDIERSFSQVLSRGKYVHSIVFHEVKPDKVDEYVELVGDWYPKVAAHPDNHVHLVGSWRTEIGDCDTFVHIWEYEKYKGYHNSLHTIQNTPGFEEFDHKLKQLINSKKVSLMQEFSFWPTTPPRALGGVFELRSYTLLPGKLMEWEAHWQGGLKARREVMEGVGAWFVQIGELNTVHFLWQFADLEERRRQREQSWERPGWPDTVHKTVPLIQTMKSRIMIPMPWSPTA